ncbi:hypothetical protein AB0G82_36200 [Streptomyces anulatus]|uniref:hypothetical protein n=1 Tax=Streptomyces anulatus TaxID=1892 RepID=UPI0033E20D1F
MTAAAAPQTGTEDVELIGRCYTKARRRPLVTGTVPGGTGRNIRLIGGPYTVTELGTMVGVFLGLLMTRRFWGGGGITDLVVITSCSAGAAFALRYVSIDGRNPLAALIGTAAMLLGPAGGRLNGRAYRAGSAHRTRTLITLHGGTGETSPEPASATARPPHSAPVMTPSGDRPPTRPAPSGRRDTTPSPPTADGPVLSGVQALLARRTATTSHSLEP